MIDLERDDLRQRLRGTRFAVFSLANLNPTVDHHPVAGLDLAAQGLGQFAVGHHPNAIDLMPLVTRLRVVARAIQQHLEECNPAARFALGHRVEVWSCCHFAANVDGVVAWHPIKSLPVS